MIAPTYFELLAVDENTSPEDVKKAYHAQAKNNHPDLFPENERQIQQLKMMKINEAYISIMAFLRSRSGNPPSPAAEFREEERAAFEDIKGSAEGEYFPVGTLKDPAYTYYKLGFDLYNRGQVVFHKRFMKKGRTIYKIFQPSSEQLLSVALTALRCFESSYAYFLRVITDHPNSMWASDARDKLHTLEKFNTIYQKICENISTKFENSEYDDQVVQ